MPSDFQDEENKMTRADEKAAKARQRQLEKATREAETAAMEKRLEMMEYRADQLNRELNSKLDQLRSILEYGLTNPIDPNLLIGKFFVRSIIPSEPISIPKPPNKKQFERQIPPRKFLERLTGIGKGNRRKIIDDITRRYKEAVGTYKIEKYRYDAEVQARADAVTTKQKEIEGFRSQLAAKNPKLVEQFLTIALESSSYPSSFGKRVLRLSYNAESSELVLEYELPSFDSTMPKVKEYKYVRTRDAIAVKSLTRTDEKMLRDLYEDVLSAIALRTIHEVFAVDHAEVVQTVVFNGMITTVDKATGHDVRPCLISVQVNRAEFTKIDLKRVDKRACLKHLKAQTSPSSAELVPVKPIVQLILTDSRFIEEVDILTSLDSRPNLIEISPGDFEHLIANLFSQMGFKTGTTRITRDQGVDVIAFHEDPILGGKVIIQAKRYRNTVDVESVRALYGIMQDEGAIKGILVTTSSFGKASREFAKGKPIELIDGNGLLHYLEQQGYQAKIVLPN